MVRLAASNTHLYPGARLAPIDDAMRIRKGTQLSIEFADGAHASGAVTAAAKDCFVAAIAAHVTARGTSIPAKTWQLNWSDDGRMLVASRAAPHSPRMNRAR